MSILPVCKHRGNTDVKESHFSTTQIYAHVLINWAKTQVNLSKPRTVKHWSVAMYKLLNQCSIFTSSRPFCTYCLFNNGFRLSLLHICCFDSTLRPFNPTPFLLFSYRMTTNMCLGSRTSCFTPPNYLDLNWEMDRAIVW